MARGLINLAALLQKRGDLAGAEPLARSGADMFDRTLGRDHWNTGAARMRVGQILSSLNRFSQAELEFVEAERVFSIAQGVPAAIRKKCLEALIALYESWDKADPGKGHDAKAAEWKAKLDALTSPQEPAVSEKK